MDFTNKVILITGASSGIGAGAAIYFSKLNANLALVGRNAENLEKTIEKCIDNVDNKINIIKKPLAIVADVTTDSKHIINETIQYFGKLDILINNAGCAGYGSIETTDVKTFDDCLNTNLRSVFILTKLAVPHLINSSGNIINVSSALGIRSAPNKISYCTSKSALDQFTKCLALELTPKGVRVNSVNPGAIVTNFQKNNGLTDEQYEEFLRAAIVNSVVGRVGYVDDVSPAIAFLADNKLAGFMTGVCLPIDGGLHILSVR